MKLLIIGGSGVIGSYLVRSFLDKSLDIEFTYLKNNIILSKEGHKLDITKKDYTINLISKINPDVVIHTTALTNVDECENNHSLADAIHVDGTANVIEGCKITKSKIVYVSTSFVFDGKKKSYSEDDKPSPSTYYGITKYKGEELIKKSDLKYLIVRTDQPYCWSEHWQHTNSVLRIIQTIKSGKIHKEITDWYNTPTYVPDFVNSLYALLSNKKEGIFHLVGSDYISRSNWALITAEVFGLDKKMIELIPSSKLNLNTKRDNVNISNEKLFRETGIKMMDVREGLLDMLNHHPINPN